VPNVDIHTHILPGLDDGPTTVEDSLAMARAAGADGTDTIIATPHFLDMELEGQTFAQVRELADTLNAALQSDSVRRNSPPVRIFTGMTYRLDTALPDLVTSESVITLNRTRFVLVEPPFNRCPPYVEDVLGRILTQRLVPVLAHPERNTVFQRQPGRLGDLVEDGVLVQISAGSITGEHGPAARRAAEIFIRRGIAHVVASEMHSITAPRAPELSPAFSLVSNWVGDSAAYDLFETNPEMIIEGRSPQRERAIGDIEPRRFLRMPDLSAGALLPERKRRNIARRWRMVRRRLTRA